MATRPTLSDESGGAGVDTSADTLVQRAAARAPAGVRGRAAALRLREERLRLALEAANVAMWDWDVETGKLEWSGRLAGIYEQNPGSSRGCFDAFLQTILPEDRERVLATFQETLRDGGKYRVEYRQLGENGELKWIEARGKAICDDAGRPARMVGIFTDVTAHKSAEEDLREVHEELEARVGERTFELAQLNEVLSEKVRLLEIAHDGIIVRSVNSSILFWNQGAELMYGWRAEEAAGKTVHALLKTRFPVPYEAIEAQLFASGWWEGQLVHTRRDGVQIIVSSRHVLRRNDEGRPVSVLEINRDITAQQRAEVAHEESESRLRAILEATDDAVFEFTEEGVYVNLWTSNDELLVLPRKDLIGRRVDQVLGREAGRPFHEAFSRVLASGRPESIEYSLPFANAKRWFLGRISPIKAPDFPGRRLCLCVREITERKRAEDALRESAERFRLVVEGVRDYAIFTLDPAGHVLSWNQGAARIKGYRADEIIGKRFSVFYSPEDLLAGRPDALLRIATAEGRVEDEGWRVRKDGSRFWADVVITALRDERGNLRGFSKVTRDVTERRRAEEALRQLSGRLLRLQDEERRRMARELHDSTAQTLAALSLNLALLKQRGGEPEDPRAAKALAESMELADQASREIRTFSYLLHPPMLDEAGLPHALRWYADGFARRTGIAVDIDISPDLDRLPADAETALFRITQECLTNIHRHSGSTTARIQLGLGSGNVMLRISDEGKGLREDTIRDRETDPAALGVGIRGMRERVRQLGGRLEIKRGQPGTIVEVTLPLAGEQA
jgi:PAS domain S-box-containing protein